MSETIASTILKQQGTDNWFRVSTINRACSAAGSYGSLYAETMVWPWDVEKRDHAGHHIWQGECANGSIRKHNETVENIYKYGNADGDGASE